MTSPHRKNSIFNMMSFSPTLNMLASSPSSFATPSPFALRHRDSYVHQRELESQFCRDLVCCNQPIADLHELLQHYEEQHVEVHANDETSNSKGPEEEDEDEEMEEDTNGNLPILLSSQDMSELEHEGNTTGTTTVDVMGNGANGVLGMDFHFGAPGIMHPDADKPYRCDVPGCDKAYKNPNGLKYHRMHGHCESTDSDNEADALQKPYQCTVMGCKKRYKNMNGLKYHIEHSHIKKMQNALPAWMTASPWQQSHSEPLQHPPHLVHPHSQQQPLSEPIQRPSQLLQQQHQQQLHSLPQPSQSRIPQPFL